MSTLLIDLGNSALHWCLETEGRLSPMQRFIYRASDIREQCRRQWSGLPPPARVALCSVASAELTRQLADEVHGRWSLEPQLFRTRAEQMGVRCGYKEPERLGTDRWLALIAAYTKSRSACCIVDCGTAVTFDAVDEGGRHLGGWIFPGDRLYSNSLTQQTAGIDVRWSEISSDILGRDTQSGIGVGWRRGLTSLIASTLGQLEQRQQMPFIPFLTGGSAEQVIHDLPGTWHYEPDLVLQGLALAAAENRDYDRQ